MRYIPKKSRNRKFKRWFLFNLTVIIVFLVMLTLPMQKHLDVANAARSMQLPLSSRGAEIVDATGKKVLLRGINWFGIETESHAPHGLWTRDYKEMLAQIESLGFNFIRLPYSVESLRSTEISGIDYSIGSNQELIGLTPLEVMDRIIAQCDRQGLLVLLDSHRLNDERIPQLWYGDGFTEADWINTWKMLAVRYKNQANIIGADLKNEPHGKASWGTDDLATDWRLAAERAGNAILSVNPNWLIVVEGVEKNVPGQKLAVHWQGGNLEGVKRYPVRLSAKHKLVYSPHEYGSGVYDQPYFSDQTFPQNLEIRWEIAFNYIATEKIAPILIGEFGGRQVSQDSPEGIWQNKLTQYIHEHDLSFAYWSWNPNSSDTGGLLQDDWQTVDVAKQQLLSPLLSGFAEAIPARPVQRAIAHSVESEPKVSINQLDSNAATLLNATSDVYSDWHQGFCVSFKISNQGSTPVKDWQLKFQMQQAAIDNSWNGNFQKQGAKNYLVTPLEWGRVIEPGQLRDVGFCANKFGSGYQPQQIEIQNRS